MALIKKLYDAAHPNLTSNDQTDRNHFYWSSEWRKLSARVKERDNYECQVCKSEGLVTLDKLLVHHIKPVEFYPEDKLNAENLIVVCLECHNRIHYGEKKLKWDDEWW